LNNLRAIIQECLKAIGLVIKLGRVIMSTNIFTKFDKDRMKTIWLRERKPYFWTILDDSRAIIQGCMGDLAGYRDIMPNNILTKFDKDRMKTLWLRERTHCGKPQVFPKIHPVYQTGVYKPSGNTKKYLIKYSASWIKSIALPYF